MKHPTPRRNTIFLRVVFVGIVITLIPGSSIYSQISPDSLCKKIQQKFITTSAEKASKLENKVRDKSIQTLEAMEKLECKIYRLLSKQDAAPEVKLQEVKEKYATLKLKLRSVAGTGGKKIYIPQLDTVSVTLRFLEQQGANGKVKEAHAKIEALQEEFQQAEEVKQFILERKEELRSRLEGLGMIKELKQINKQVYYYAAQLNEYREILKDARKAEKKAIELLSNTKLWKDFFKKNSMLARVFRVPSPDDPSYAANMAGLQTRAQVNGLIQQQIAIGGAGARDQLRANLERAQSKMLALKNKIPASGGSSDDIMPEGFKPNEQKTKTFLSRIQIGTSLQMQKATPFFPQTSDIGLSLGYKLNGKSIIGIGGSYKLGLGRGWNHMKFSSEGVGLRSFIDWKLKGNFWITGGYEMNFMSAFRNFSQLQELNGWQRSGLLGLSKVTKKVKVQLLWDFLSYKQLPRTQAIIFRTGYNLK